MIKYPTSHSESVIKISLQKKSELYHFTVFENHRKSPIQHYEQSELRLHFEGTKIN